MTALRYIFLALHIISAGIWFAQIVADLGFRAVLRDSAGKPNELALLMARMRVVGYLGQIGGPGILLTGLGLLWADGYALFGIGGFTPAWLFIKQIIYVIALGIVFAFVQPGARRVVPQFMEAAKSAQTVTPEMRSAVERVITYSHITNLLVVINIVLAVWKPT